MRIDQLTCTRFFSAMGILLFHYGAHAFPFSIPIIGSFINNTSLVLSYFFVLSGFIMIISYSSQNTLDTKQYLIHRFARIYPIYIIALFLVLIPKSIVLGLPNLWDIILHIFMLQAWVPGTVNLFNYPGWSISVEFFFYLVFPFLFNILYKKYQFRTLAIWIIGFWCISQTVHQCLVHSSMYQTFPSKIHDFIYYFPLNHLNQFLIGNLTGLLFLQYQHKKGNYDKYLIGILCALFLAILYPIGLDYFNGTMAILFAPFLFFLSLNTGKFTALFKHRFLVFLGEISFALYMLQCPIFRIMKEMYSIAQINNPTLQFYSSFIALLIVSALSYIYIETPLRKRIRSRLSQI